MTTASASVCAINVTTGDADNPPVNSDETDTNLIVVGDVGRGCVDVLVVAVVVVVSDSRAVVVAVVVAVIVAVVVVTARPCNGCVRLFVFANAINDAFN
jgi:hypothetical protein